MARKSILFVDDEESILEIAKEFFEQKDYSVFTASNGVEALKLLEYQSVDCCFTDINMAEMDGLTLAEEIRKKDNTLPVVIMTGYPSMENTLQTLKNGVVDFLIKPINLNQMELCLKRVLRERELFIGNILLKKEVENKKRLEELNFELSDKVDELSRLNQIMSEFTNASSTEDVFYKLIKMTLDISGADEAGLYLVNESKKRASLYLSMGEDDFFRKKEIADDLFEGVISDSMPVLISNDEGDGFLPDEFKSLMMNPLIIKGKIFAVIVAGVTESETRFGKKDLFYISFLAQKAAYAIENLALYENIYDNLFSTLYAFVTAIEARDHYTSQHSNRVASLAVHLGRALGCSEEDLDVLHFAGRLHDIGKIGVRDGVLLKDGRLTPEEFEEIKKHPVIGANIVGKLGLWNKEESIIRYHHERFDGTGYPEGLKGTDIPYLARITSVVDAYDAMASDRAYRKKLPKDEIIRNLENGSGTQFDPFIVKVFLEMVKKDKFLLNDDNEKDEIMFG